VEVTIDTRERVGVSVADYLKRRGWMVRFGKLDAGDYLVSGSECFLVERKTLGDLANSVKTLRLWRELEAVKSVEGAKPILLVELTGSLGGFRPESLYGVLASVQLDFNIPILYSFRRGETPLVIERLCVRASGVGGSRRLAFKPKARSLREEQLRIVSMLPGVSTARAEKLLERFGSVRRVFEASIEELASVEGIGEKTARRIYELVNAKFG